MSTLHYSALQFFESRMSTHSRVNCYTRIPIADEYIYTISRNDSLPNVNVWLSDAYHFGLADYLGRPSCIKRGDFILVVSFLANFGEASDRSTIERAAKDGIGIGNYRLFMGALNYYLPSAYIRRKA